MHRLLLRCSALIGRIFLTNGKWQFFITPPIDKIQILADYFDVSLDYLVGNTNFQTAEERNEINPLDIAQQMKSILECLQNSNYALLYEGDELAPECREFLKTSFESNLKMSKLLNSRKNRAVS